MFNLEKPNLNSLNKKRIIKIIEKRMGSDFAKKVSNEKYLYWDKARHQKPSPNELTKEELWFAIKLFRAFGRHDSVIKDTNNRSFSWAKLDHFDAFFHELDMNTGGELFSEKTQLNQMNKQKLIMRGIMEEAIASSQLEGAATSRRVAKKMLLENRKPTNHSEQMILNSYKSMQAIETRYKNEKMSMDLILELHQLITTNTKDSKDETPRLREQGEPVYIAGTNNVIYFEAPNATFVKHELKRLIDFANDELKESIFIHPIIKAIMLHFWIGYLHPFTDGNGRFARLLFYWYLLKKGYWAFAYLPLSRVIKRSLKQYIMSYVYSEQDDNDLNYFINYNVNKIKIAIEDFKKYLDEKATENMKMKKIAETLYGLNIRQSQLLQHLYGQPEEKTTLTTHMTINQVSKMTAIKDLKDLVQKGFLTASKQGLYVNYYGTEKIKELFV